MLSNSTPPELLQKTPWDEADKSLWLQHQNRLRSYGDDVVNKIKALEGRFDIELYGALTFNPERYPLFVIKSKNWDTEKPCVLVTGGVHGYETSGVLGALRFLETSANDYVSHFNLLVAPCVSPWAYETINRWNPHAVDPNRSFKSGSSAEEAIFLMQYVSSLHQDFLAHIDLHETTDTDNTTFRPALAARDGVKQSVWNIPDGFYLVGNSEKQQAEFQKAIIESVRQVTHIAPSDESGKIIGEPITQEGVINYPMKKSGLCAGFTNSEYATTTEVYPDSPEVSDEECILAQVAAVTGALEYLKTVR